MSATVTAIGQRQSPAPAVGGGAGREAAQRPTLGKNAPNSSAGGDEAVRERRNAAWVLRRRLWEISTLPRVRACGRVSRTGGGPVLRVSGEAGARRAGLAGLVRCASPWSCSCCARRIGAQRAQEIREVVAAVDVEGGSCGLATFTLRHHRGHRLADSWSALRKAWARITSGRAYEREKMRFGIVGWIAAVEVTYSERNGFHPHLHAVLIFDSPLSPEMLAELGGGWFARFERALRRHGFDALEFDGGLDTRTVTADSGGALAVYLAKLALEVTGSTRKTGRRHGSRTMWEVLADGLATGLADDLEVWAEYEQASHGRKQITFSRGLRRRYRLAAEETDEAIVEADLGGTDVLVIAPNSWPMVRLHAEELLDVAELYGVDAARGWLAARGLNWIDTHEERERSP